MKKLIATSLVFTSLLAGGLTLRPAFADSCCKNMTNAATSAQCKAKCEKDTKSSACCKKGAATAKTAAKPVAKTADTTKH
jgi:hypothetical protein